MANDTDNGVDNIINFAKKTPEKLRILWRKNFQISEAYLTSKVDPANKKVELTDKHEKKIIDDIHATRKAYFTKMDAKVAKYREGMDNPVSLQQHTADREQGQHTIPTFPTGESELSKSFRVSAKVMLSNN